MKLSICIPHYKEETSVVRDLLDSIQMQQNVDFNEIEAIIMNDGGDFAQVSKIKKKDYSFKLKIFETEHAGLSATRNKAFAHATGEYVTFCDADDMFYTVNALNLIFQIMERKPFQMLISSFIEELHLPDGKVAYYQHPIDVTFVHGKFYNRQFLIDNDIKFDPAVGRHQDSPFARLALMVCDKSKLVEVKVPFYLWRWFDTSLCRRDKELSVVNSEWSYIDGVNSSVNELLKRDMIKEASFTVAHLLYKLYFLLNSEQFLDPKNEEYRIKTETRFKQFYDKFIYLFDNVPQDARNKLIRQYKEDAANRYGVVLERFTFDNWIKHIESIETD